VKWSQGPQKAGVVAELPSCATKPGLPVNPGKLSGEQIELARRLIGEGASVPEASRILQVHRTTLYRALQP
jgi:hypothetical protein